MPFMHGEHHLTTAILSALPEEQAGLLALLQNPERTVRAGREFWQGIMHGKPVVLALSRIGKVAAATTATSTAMARLGSPPGTNHPPSSSPSEVCSVTSRALGSTSAGDDSAAGNGR